MPIAPTTSAAPIPIACILGPTASGKTAAALAFAARAAAQGRVVEIVSVDSALVYRDMDIGTAKPDAVERAAVAHHLIDIVDPVDAYSAARFRADALHVIARVLARGHVPLLVGGTMLYYRALTQGLNALPAADPAVRATLDADAARDGWPALHARLAQIDPATAARLAPNDAQRIQRALEVFMLSGQPMSALLAAGNSAGNPAGNLAGALATKISVMPEKACASGASNPADSHTAASSADPASLHTTTSLTAPASSNATASSTALAASHAVTASTPPTVPPAPVFPAALATLSASTSPAALTSSHTPASSTMLATSPTPAPQVAQTAAPAPISRDDPAYPSPTTPNARPGHDPASPPLYDNDTAAAYRFVPIALEPSVRSVLHERIAQRFDAMLAHGFIDEVKALRARGDLHPGLPSMRCVGYRQAWAYLDGEIDYRAMRDQSVFATRQLCKRQLTWLRAMPGRIVIDCCAENALHQTVEALARINE